MAVGKITKAHGIKGEVKISSYSGNLTNLHLYQSLVLAERSDVISGQPVDNRHRQTYDIKHSRTQGKVTIVRLLGISSRNAAETLCGLYVLIPKKILPPLQAGQYYWHNLHNMRVITDLKQELGRLTGLLAAGGHNVLIVHDDQGKEYLIPARDEFIAKVDTNAGIIIITPPPGLLELNP